MPSRCFCLRVWLPALAAPIWLRMAQEAEGPITRLATALVPGTAVATVVAPAMAAVPGTAVALATAAQMALERDRPAMALARAKVVRGRATPAVRPPQVRPDAVTTRRSSSVSATKTTIAVRPSGTKPALSWLTLQVAARAEAPHPTAVAPQAEVLVAIPQAGRAAILLAE